MALTREAAYIAAVASLTLPHVVGDPDRGNDVAEQTPTARVNLTPFNAPLLIRKMQTAFPDAKHLRFPEGEDGDVVWLAGVGHMQAVADGPGYRPCGVSREPGVHVFLDYSNIFFGLVAFLQRADSTSLPPKHQRVLSLPLLSLLLVRARPTSRGALHAVASSPCRQDLDPLVRLGWEVSVLKRVELQDVERPVQ
ncbi:hypothetical protein Q5752_005114 [Cryptotrichosporon argae]